MIFKILLIGGLLFLLYRTVVPPLLEGKSGKPKIKKGDADEEYVDYEEMD